MVDVFISYAREDQAMVRRLADAVKGEGYSVWWDEELPPHLSYGDVITEKIDSAKAAIVVWSELAAKSEWVRAEADVARNRKKLIQTSIDGRMPPMPFNQIQFAVIGDWHGEADHLGWQRVKASLAMLCGSGAAAPAPPSPPPAGAPAPRRSRLITVLAAALLAALLALAWLLWPRGGEVPSATMAHRPAQPEDIGPRIVRPAGTAAERADSGRDPIFPDSSVRLLGRSDLRGLSPADLRNARHEIFARHGRAWGDPRTRRRSHRDRSHRSRAGEIELNPIERANVRLLIEAEGR